MGFIEEIKKQAKASIKTICLPEAEDIIILKATQTISKEGFAKIVLIGNNENILKVAKDNNIDISDATIIDPLKSENANRYANKLYELRREKGMTEDQAKELVKDPVYFGMMMVKLEDANGLVSGACHSTADTLRPALQIIKTLPRNQNSFNIFCNEYSKL